MTEQMTRQQVFERVARHLIAQGVRSSGPLTRSAECWYRGPEGRKCAIGCLIPDEVYKPEMDHGGPSGTMLTDVVNVLNTHELLEACGLAEMDMAFLKQLQEIHDGHSPKNWAGQLCAFACSHELDASFMTELSMG